MVLKLVSGFFFFMFCLQILLSKGSATFFSQRYGLGFFFCPWIKLLHNSRYFFLSSAFLPSHDQPHVFVSLVLKFYSRCKYLFANYTFRSTLAKKILSCREPLDALPHFSLQALIWFFTLHLVISSFISA